MWMTDGLRVECDQINWQKCLKKLSYDSMDWGRAWSIYRQIGMAHPGNTRMLKLELNFKVIPFLIWLAFELTSFIYYSSLGFSCTVPLVLSVPLDVFYSRCNYLFDQNLGCTRNPTYAVLNIVIQCIIVWILLLDLINLSEYDWTKVPFLPIY